MPIQTLAGWVIVPLILLAAYGWAAWLVSRLGEDGRVRRTLIYVLTLALSVGALTQIMFWLSLLHVRLDALVVTVIYGLAMLPGWWLWGRSSLYHNTEAESREQEKLDALPLSQFALIILLVLSGAILFNAAYWPFSRDDAIGIYDAQAQEIASTGAILPLTGVDSLYRAYPPLMPLIYAYTYTLSGWHNEYLARIVPALMSLGALVVAYVLGREVGAERAGWFSALIFAVTPTFGRWAAAGYVDLPMAFYYALSAFFALRLWRTGHWVDALLAGMMMGFAAWTKNAALIGVGLLGIWLLWMFVNRRIDFGKVVLCAAACAAIAAPWYIRNLVGAGFLLPDTAWTEDAEHTSETALIFITHPEIYGFSGWLFMVGFGLTVWRVARKPRSQPGESLLLLWTVPFFALWWWFASYDPRFLLHILPLCAVMAGSVVVEMSNRIPARWQRVAAVAGGTLFVVLAAQAIWNSVEFKDEILRAPLMGDTAKHEIVLRGRDSE